MYPSSTFSGLKILNRIYKITDAGIAELRRLKALLENEPSKVGESRPIVLETAFQKWRREAKDEIGRNRLMHNLLIDLLAYFAEEYPESQLVKLARSYWKDGRFSKTPAIREFQFILDNWRKSGLFEVDAEGYVIPSPKLRRPIRREGENVVYYIAYTHSD